MLERGKRKTRLDPAEFSETGKQRGVKKNIKKKYGGNGGRQRASVHPQMVFFLGECCTPGRSGPIV